MGKTIKTPEEIKLELEAKMPKNEYFITVYQYLIHYSGSSRNGCTTYHFVNAKSGKAAWKILKEELEEKGYFSEIKGIVKL